MNECRSATPKRWDIIANRMTFSNELIEELKARLQRKGGDIERAAA